MFWGKTISSKKIGEVQNFTSYKQIIKTEGKKSNLLKIFVVILCIVFVGYFGKQILQWAQFVGSQIGKWAVTVVSNSLWEEMQKDEFGNINIMILGYGGKGHAGSSLADSIMVASRNPKLGAVTMLSVPRDLYVNTSGTHIKGRINEVFAVGVGGKKQQFETWAKYMKDQLEAIMGLEIPYHVLIDFEWFEWVVDSLWWVDIFVEKPIFDPTYPSNEKQIMTFKVGSGMQHFDGKTALMYSRSRHSTSDFDRSLRQQQIVQAIIKKITSKDILFSPSKIKDLYTTYTEMVKTNITADEMIGASKYAYDLKNIFSFGYTTNCSNSARKFSTPACFLISPPRELFAGAAVMIPVGPSNDPSFYDYTKKFAFYVTHNQKYLIEHANIVIENGIDKKYAKQTKRKPDWHANAIAAKLKKYAFNVINVENTKTILSGTTVFIVGTGTYDETIKALKNFIFIDSVVEAQAGTWEQVMNTTWADIVVVLGNSYLDTTEAGNFSYYR